MMNIEGEGKSNDERGTQGDRDTGTQGDRKGDREGDREGERKGERKDGREGERESKPVITQYFTFPSITNFAAHSATLVSYLKRIKSI